MTSKTHVVKEKKVEEDFKDNHGQSDTIGFESEEVLEEKPKDEFERKQK